MKLVFNVSAILIHDALLQMTSPFTDAVIVINEARVAGLSQYIDNSTTWQFYCNAAINMSVHGLRNS